MVSKTNGNMLGSHSGGIAVHVRPISKYTNLCHKYLIQERTFDRQYASFYISRLRVTIPRLHEQAKWKWGSEIPIKQLCDVSGNENCIIIGTLYKHMELHPSILREISEEHNLIPQPVTEEFTKDDDFLILEDNLQRVILCGNIDPHSHVTGVNIAIYGYTEEGGKFFVEDVCYPAVFEPDILPVFLEDRFVVLVSGFGLGDPNVLFPIQLLIDTINGQLGEEQDQKRFSQVIRVIIAGNSIGIHTKDFFAKAKFLTRKSKATTVENVKALDDILAQLVTSVDVDLMPGEFDPANHLLPQQPLHPCMFPKSSKYSTFNVVTNPYHSIIDGVRFLGSSGQNIKDIRAYSKLSDALDIMEKTLDWGHLCPTAPDTLNCYPYLDEDPFVLNEYPHIYFAGNMPKMDFRQYGEKPVLMVSVPKFQETYTATLINLRTLEVEPITFGYNPN